MTLLVLFWLVGQTSAGAVCTGDCDGDGVVAIFELVRGVNLAVGNPTAPCDAFDANGDGRVAIDEVVDAVLVALDGCPDEPDATSTPVPTASPVPSFTPEPTVVIGPTDFYRRLAAARETSVYIDDSGDLWAFGNNAQGRLGNGTTEMRFPLQAHAYAPVPLTSVQGLSFAHVTAGDDFFLALTAGGDLYAWGSNEQGQIGNDDQGVDVLSPTLVLSDVVTADAIQRRAVVLDDRGRIWSWGRSLGPAPVEQPAPPDVTIVQLAVGQEHWLALDDTGQVWGWGGNSQGQLGDGGATLTWPEPARITLEDNITPLDGIVAIEAGYLFSVVLDRQGSLLTFGDNLSGELATGDTIDRKFPGPVIATGSPGPFTVIASNSQHTLAVDDTGTGWGFGRNVDGVVPVAPVDCRNTCNATVTPFDGAAGIELVEVAAGVTHGIGLDTGGQLWGWGRNADGQLGWGNVLDSGDKQNVPREVLMPGGRFPRALFAEHNTDSPRTAVTFDNGELWVFGRHGHASGTLVEGASPALVEGLVGNAIVSYCTGSRFAIAVDDTGVAYSFGENRNGELGNGDLGVTSTDVWLPVTFPEAGVLIDRVECSHNTAYALDRTGGLWAWGDDGAGQLGDVMAHPSNETPSPVRVGGVDGVGVLTNVIDFDASVASPSREHAAALLSDGTVVVWGAFQLGALGRTAPESCGFPCSRVPVRVCAPGTADLSDCDDVGNGANAAYLDNIDEISVASGGVLARAGNTLFSWGDNNQGELGQGNEDVDTLVPGLVSAGTPPITGNVIQLATGNDFAMVLNDEGDVWIWGSNDMGQLGKGDDADMNCSGNETSCFKTPHKMDALDAANVIYVEAGYDHAAALDDQGRVWTWGRNASGELGHQATEPLGGGHTGALSPEQVILLPR